MRLLWALLLVLAASATALAQDYPTRNVIFIVPTGAGAATDLLARILAPQLGDRLGKPFVVEDRPGAGTLTASNAVAKATPDGYTILMGTSTPLAINATLYKHLPYDPVKDFMPLALDCNDPIRPGGQQRSASAFRGRAYRIRKGAPWRIILWFDGPWDAVPPECRIVQRHDRHPDGARALQGGGGCPGRSDGRPNTSHVHGLYVLGAAYRGRQNAGAGRYNEDARGGHA